MKRVVKKSRPPIQLNIFWDWPNQTPVLKSSTPPQQTNDIHWSGEYYTHENNKNSTLHYTLFH